MVITITTILQITKANKDFRTLTPTPTTNQYYVQMEMEII
jgi:hypothetical protein